MSTRLTIWDGFWRQQGILNNPIPLFATDDLRVRVLPFGTQKVLQRSAEMEALVVSETTKVVEDFRHNAFEGLIYMMYWKDSASVIPLYIGLTEKYGRKGGNLSANIANPRDKHRFSRWGYNPRYHIGALSAAAIDGKGKGGYPRWASVLFDDVPAERPRLKRETYFWMSAWKSGTVGPWEEFGATPLTSLEYLLIALAGALFPEHLLNVEGINRGPGLSSTIHEAVTGEEHAHGRSPLVPIPTRETIE